MSDNQLYLYQPTLNGFRYTSEKADDPLRTIPAILYPDNRRERIFDAETMKQIQRYPFRPVVCAMTAPRYRDEGRLGRIHPPRQAPNSF